MLRKSRVSFFASFNMINYLMIKEHMMNCQVYSCRKEATHKKTESHEIENPIVLIVKTETMICDDHAELISKSDMTEVSIDTL